MAAHSITLKVDAATFNRWAAAVVVLRSRFRVPLRQVGKIPFKLPTAIEFSGLELLRQLGLACSRLQSEDDPARLFGILKYATALAAHRRRRGLCLANDVRDTDSHKLRVLSDEFGCAFCFLVAQQLFGIDRFMDLRGAIRDGWVRTSAPKSRQPDYAGLSASAKLAILEAKGTKSGAGYSRRQIESGCDQLSKCSLGKKGKTIDWMAAIGASLTFQGQRAGVVVHVGDPPPGNEHTFEFVSGPDETILRGHFLQAAILAGDDVLVRHLRGADDGEDETQDVPSRRAGRFLGSEVVIGNGESEMRLFLGIDSVVRERIRGGAYAAASRVARSRTADERGTPRWSRVDIDNSEPEEPTRWPSQSVWSDEEESPFELGDLEHPSASLGDDGSMVELSFNSPATDRVRKLLAAPT